MSQSPFHFSASRRVVYRRAKRTLSQALLKGWTGSRAGLERRVRTFLRGKRRDYLLKLVRQRAFAVTVAGALLAGAQAQASSPIELSDVTAGTGGFVINGVDAGDQSGLSVSGAGDVNGDGLADLIVGALSADNGRGESFVVFGKTNGTTVDLSAIASGTGGFMIHGIDVGDDSGISVSGAGDVNGDGLADVIVGAWEADVGGSASGESYVVFGKTDGTTVELSTITVGTGGFVINGIDSKDYAGRSVSGAGDVNGDGLADLIVGANRADPGGNAEGESYVVFGKADGAAVELSAVTSGTGGFVINGDDASDRSGMSVSGAGDVNGDGLADLIIGAPWTDNGGPYGTDGLGTSYVVFGKIGGTAIELSSIVAGTGGFAINGINFYDLSGYSVSGADDVNGDGLADLIVGAPTNFQSVGTNAGTSYVVFGKGDGTTVELSAVASGTGGFLINGDDAYDYSGSVSNAGDVNGDGLADLIVGARGADPGGVSSAGESYVVFGKADGTVVELSTVAAGTGGFILKGIDEDDRLGDVGGVSSAGDVDGDGLADLIVGARRGDPNGNSQAGESYVVFSPETAPASATYKAVSRAGDGAGGEIVVPTVLDDARMTIDYSDEDTADDGSGGASLETVVLHRDRTGITNFPSVTAADVYWEFSTDRVGWTSAEITLKYTDAEVSGLWGPESAYLVYVAPAASGPWTLATASLDTVRNEASLTTTTDFVFTIASSSIYETWADFGYIGTESGTEAEPFNTIQEAVDSVTAEGVVHLNNGFSDLTSSETPTLSKAVTLQSTGGTFRIGVPAARNSRNGDAEEGFVSKER